MIGRFSRDEVLLRQTVSFKELEIEKVNEEKISKLTIGCKIGDSIFETVDLACYLGDIVSSEDMIMPLWLGQPKHGTSSGS